LKPQLVGWIRMKGEETAKGTNLWGNMKENAASHRVMLCGLGTNLLWEDQEVSQGEGRD